MNGKKILLLLGGTWHDFDGFAKIVGGVLEKAGHAVKTTRDLNQLKQLASGTHDVVMIYTCLTEKEEDGSLAKNRLRDEHAAPLAEWVAGGGSLLAVHGATISSQSSPVFHKLVGGLFLAHPPVFTLDGSTSFVFPFAVHPLFIRSQITDGLDSFTVQDEFYLQQYNPDVTIQMAAMERGVVHPMVWTRTEGAGRVAHIAMGHDARTWNQQPYQKLVLQSVVWLTAGHPVGQRQP